MTREGRRTSHWCRIFPLAFLVLATATASWANQPLSGQHYPMGAEDFVVGALPPPGVYLKTYIALFQKDRLTDNDGHIANAPGGGPNIDLEADVTAVVPRFIWVTPWQLFGASVATQVFFPLHWTNVRSDVLGGSWADAENSGLGDIIFTPIALGWHFGPNLHLILAEDLFLPTGDYDADDPASQILSKNCWTFESVAAISYLTNGFDFSAKLMYDFNTKNDDYTLGGLAPESMDLESGQEFHVDYAVSYARSEGLRYGLSGYYYMQVTEDKIDGEKVDDNKGRIAAIGPTIKYWPKQGRFSAVLKHQWEFGAKNLPEGQTSWLNIVWVF